MVICQVEICEWQSVKAICGWQAVKWQSVGGNLWKQSLCVNLSNGNLSKHLFHLFCHKFVRNRNLKTQQWCRSKIICMSYMIYDIWPGTVEEGRWPAHRHHHLARPPWFEFDKSSSATFRSTFVSCSMMATSTRETSRGSTSLGWTHKNYVWF